MKSEEGPLGKIQKHIQFSGLIEVGAAYINSIAEAGVMEELLGNLGTTTMLTEGIEGMWCSVRWRLSFRSNCIHEKVHRKFFK